MNLRVWLRWSEPTHVFRTSRFFGFENCLFDVDFRNRNSRPMQNASGVVDETRPVGTKVEREVEPPQELEQPAELAV